MCNEVVYTLDQKTLIVHNFTVMYTICIVYMDLMDISMAIASWHGKQVMHMDTLLCVDAYIYIANGYNWSA